MSVYGRIYCYSLSKASIRAYSADKAFLKESLHRIDKYTRAARTFYNLNRCVMSDVFLSAYIQC
jgi:hypothetical protein